MNWVGTYDIGRTCYIGTCDIGTDELGRYL